MLNNLFDLGRGPSIPAHPYTPKKKTKQKLANRKVSKNRAKITVEDNTEQLTIEIPKQIKFFDSSQFSFWRKANNENLKQPYQYSKNILLANGFSIDYSPVYCYSNILEALKQQENLNISDEIIRTVEEASGNFEQAIKNHPELTEGIQHAFIETVCRINPENATKVTEEQKKEAWSQLLYILGWDESENKNKGSQKIKTKVFTLNYDLLLYWLIVNQTKILKDGFGYDESKSYECTLKHPNVCYLHGALHLFKGKTRTNKVKFIEGETLKEQISRIMDKKEFPVIVAEANSEEKMKKINDNDYLKSRFEDFMKVEGELFIYGFSFNPNFDQHIINAINMNNKLSSLSIGIHHPTFENDDEKIIKEQKRIQELFPNSTILSPPSQRFPD